MSISDTDFIAEFENQTLDPQYFNHYGHLRLAWLYLNSYTLDEAVIKVTQGISLYANSLGAKDKFQHTMTEAIVRIMAVRLRTSYVESLDQYLNMNDDLLKDLWHVLLTYYKEETLCSDAARKAFVQPDIKPFS